MKLTILLTSVVVAILAPYILFMGVWEFTSWGVGIWNIPEWDVSLRSQYLVYHLGICILVISGFI